MSVASLVTLHVNAAPVVVVALGGVEVLLLVVAAVAAVLQDTERAQPMEGAGSFVIDDLCNLSSSSSERIN